MDRKEIAKKSVENLKRYIKEDLIYQENKPESDFDQFCIDHCKDINNVLNYISELVGDLYAANNIINDQIDLLRDSVNKSVIRNKIKEKQERIAKMNPIGDCVLIDDLETEIQALEELI